MRVLAALLALLVAAAADARTILFVGNSFTQGHGSLVERWHPQAVADLNGGHVGGVPALFAAFSHTLGLGWQVAHEAEGGRTLAWHLAERRPRLDRAWDAVVLQEYSTLDPDRPGDPARTVAAARTLAALFRARNPRVALWMNATWARPDLALRPGTGRWAGADLARMTADVRAGHDAAARAVRARGVVPTGDAFLCAVARGTADADPYDGIAPGRVALWAADHYHASAAGSYLQALVLLARVAGADPTRLGPADVTARAIGLPAPVAAALQRIARDSVRGGCGAVRRTAAPPARPR